MALLIKDVRPVGFGGPAGITDIAIDKDGTVVDEPSADATVIRCNGARR